MADIKTREVMKGTIKTFDRAEAAAHRIKDGSIRTGQYHGSRKVSNGKSRTQAARDGEERDSGYSAKAYRQIES